MRTPSTPKPIARRPASAGLVAPGWLFGTAALASLLIGLSATGLQAFADEVDVPALVARSEPGVVAIFVVRGEPYAEPSAQDPGRLGVFPSTAAERQAALLRPEWAPHDPAFVPSYVAGGAIVDQTGLVLTLYHAIRGARKLFVVTSTGKQSYADVHAADPRTDWAVLRLLTPPNAWPALPLGRAERLKKGEGMLSLETPDGSPARRLDFAASWSHVARRHREPDVVDGLAGDQAVPPYLGSVMHGDGLSLSSSSGGAVLNARGELVGLTNKLLRAGPRDGMPVQSIDDVASRIIATLLRGEEVEYGFLGVTTRGARLAAGDVAATQGVEIVSEVLDGLPAARAQLRRGDVILQINGRPLRGNADYFWALAPGMAGRGVELAILRQGRRLDVRVERLDKLAPIPGTVAFTKPPSFRGLRVDYLSTLLGQLPPERLDWQERLLATIGQGGVVVREVLPDSPAERAGIRIHELITHVNDRPVAAPADFQREVANASGPVALTVWPLDPQSPARKLRLE